MTKAEHTKLAELLERQKRVFAADPAKARAWFIEAGIYTSNGELTPEYGGRVQADARR